MNEIRGMYSFSIYDKRTDETFLVRDRLGIKPLFYTISEKFLIFSSEIKGILSSGLHKPKFNEKAVDDYLAYRYVREPNTFFKEIYHVPAGHFLKFIGNKLQKMVSYWELPNLNFDSDFKESVVIAELSEKLKETIESWAISDVSLGCYLSGGVDSSLTTAILSKKGNLNTYTVGFHNEEFNEFKYAKKVSNDYETLHNELLIDKKEYLNFIRELITFKDSPLAVPNEIPLALLSKELKKKITVVVSGEGADELFAGYGKIFRSAFDFENSDQDACSSFYDYFINKYEYVSRDDRDFLLKSKDNYRKFEDNKWKNIFKNYRNEENIFRFFHDVHIKGLLSRVDTTTMYASVEARPPFVDHELIEYVYQKVPYSLKLKWVNDKMMNDAKKNSSTVYSEVNDIPKYVLKKVAENYLSDEIIYRKKMGFPVPLSPWFNDLKDLSKILDESSWLNRNNFNQYLLNLSKSDIGRKGQILWMLINVELFRREYFDKKWIY